MLKKLKLKLKQFMCPHSVRTIMIDIKKHDDLSTTKLTVIKCDMCNQSLTIVKYHKNLVDELAMMNMAHRIDTQETTAISCQACGKVRNFLEILTFHHPIIDSIYEHSARGQTNNIIHGYENFRHCHDNLFCYIKASRKERVDKI